MGFSQDDARGKGNLPPGADDGVAKQRKCVDCGALSPLTQTSYTLISSSHGWRLSKRVLPNGDRVMEWRCPDCWDRHKKQRGSIIP